MRKFLFGIVMMLALGMSAPRAFSANSGRKAAHSMALKEDIQRFYRSYCQVKSENSNQKDPVPTPWEDHLREMTSVREIQVGSEMHRKQIELSKKSWEDFSRRVFSDWSAEDRKKLAESLRSLTPEEATRLSEEPSKACPLDREERYFWIQELPRALS